MDELDSPAQQAQSRLRLKSFLPLLVACVTVAGLVPALENNFIAWGDDKLLLENLRYRGLGWDQIRWMFTTFLMGHYQPVTWLSFGLDYLLWEMEPFGYHLTQLIFHAANAVWFYFIGRRLIAAALSLPNDKDSWPLELSAALAALLFAIHPLRVESVAWASARHDVVSGFFFLWALYCYFQATSNPQVRSYRRWLWVAVMVYSLALLSKATAMILPVLLLLLDIYPLQRLPGGPGNWVKAQFRSVVWEKLPFLVLALIFGLIALRAQQATGTLKEFPEYDVVFRVGQAFYGLMFYLWKTAVPTGLSPLYELPFDPVPWSLTFALCAVGAVVVSIVSYFLSRRWPAVLACWACYVIMLVPVLGIVPSGPDLVADRYSYLAGLSWALLAAGVICLFGWPSTDPSSNRRLRFLTVPVIIVGTLFSLGFFTWKQIGVWRDARTLWEHVLALPPPSSVAHYNLGRILEDQDRASEAIKSYRQAVSLNPRGAAAHYRLARLLARSDQREEAIVIFQRALQIDPKNAETHYHLGSLLGMRGKVEEARQHLEEAIKSKPDYAEAHSNLGNVLSMQGKPKDAAQHYRKALELDPSFYDTRFNLGTALLHLGDFTAAAEEFRAILKKRPDFAEAHFLLGSALAVRGRMTEAIGEFRETITLKPNFADGHIALGRALAMAGRTDEATPHYERALALLKSERQSAGKDK